MTHPRANLSVALAAAISLLPACGPSCDQEAVPEGTPFKVTVLAPSAECPEIVPLKAGDTLTVRAGPISDGGGDDSRSGCTENLSSGIPPEFPQFPVSPFKIGTCATGVTGEAFDCEATAPNCASGDLAGSGAVSGGSSRRPKPGEVLNADYVIGVYVGADLACMSSCFTKIPITIERL